MLHAKVQKFTKKTLHAQSCVVVSDCKPEGHYAPLLWSNMKCGNPKIKTLRGLFKHLQFCLPDEIPEHPQLHDCLHCAHCRKIRGRENADMCHLDSLGFTFNWFITLTYAKAPDRMRLRDFQLFAKKLRKYCYKKNLCYTKIYRVHEHGKNGRAHWHFVAFNLPLQVFNTEDPTIFSSHDIRQLWGHGHITVQHVNEATAMYQSLYMDKDFQNGNANNEKKAVTWHSGMGTSWFLKNYEQVMQLGYIPGTDNRKIKIPRKFLKIGKKNWELIYSPHDFLKNYRSKEYKLFYRPEFEQFKELGRLAKQFICIDYIPNKKLADLWHNFKYQIREEKTKDEILTELTDRKKALINTVYEDRKKQLTRYERF